MRNVIKIVSSVSSAALLLSGVAMAGAPSGYNADAWTVNASGIVTSTCPAGLPVAGVSPCTLLAEGTGFKQEQFDLGGKRYIRTILAEGWTAAGGALQTPTTLKFTDENLVQVGIGGSVAPQGLISRTRIVENDVPALTKTGFLTDATIKTGWGTGAGVGVGDPNRKAEVKFDLNVSERPTGAANALGANDFLSKFTFAGFTNLTDGNVEESMQMDQTMFLNNTADKQRFVSSTLPAGTRVAPAAPGFKFAANTAVPPDYMTWAPADRLQAIWIAQSVQNAGQTGTVSPFSTSVLRNKTNEAEVVGVTNLNSTALAAEFAVGGSLVTSFTTTPTF